MKLNFGPKGILQFDDVRIIFRNFRGEESAFNRKGDRNFAIVIDDRKIADALIEQGWNVKVKPPRDPDDDEFIFLPVKIKYTSRGGPVIYLEVGPKRVSVSEENIDLLDDIDIQTIDMDIAPYDWEVQGKKGRAAYLRSMRVVQNIDRFAQRYADIDETIKNTPILDDDDVPF